MAKRKKAPDVTPASAVRHGRHGVRALGVSTRDKIVDTATEFLKEEGYDDFGVREIARRAGIAPGNLGYYFPNKYTLLREVFRRQVGSLSDDMQALLDQAAGQSELTLVVIDLLMSLFYESNEVFPLWWTIWALSPYDEELKRILDEVYVTFTAALVAAIGKTHPNLDKRRTKRMARVITALLDGASVQAHVGQTSSRRRAELKRDIRVWIAAILEIAQAG